MIVVTLTPAELLMCAHVGCMRQNAAVKDGRSNRHGRGEGGEYDDHIRGACGEYAAAQALGIPWRATVNTFKAPDLEHDGLAYEVKTRSRHDYELIVRDDDDPGRVFVLVTTETWLEYHVHGCIEGDRARRREWRKAHGGREAAWFVPQAALHPVRRAA